MKKTKKINRKKVRSKRAKQIKVKICSDDPQADNEGYDNPHNYHSNSTWP